MATQPTPPWPLLNVTASTSWCTFAAETHVDRSILEAGEFIKTDVIGTFVLLEAARASQKLRCFIQISTDEVYGSVPEGSSVETDELKPRNPYSASKAGADRLAYSYWATYNVPVIVTRVEQLRPVSVSGEGHPAVHHERDRQHSGAAVRRGPQHPRLAARDGSLPRHRHGDRTRNARRGLQHRRRQRSAHVDLTHMLLRLAERPDSLIKKVQDRQGHDMRYSSTPPSCK